jgi:hypothetical protein
LDYCGLCDVQKEAADKEFRGLISEKINTRKQSLTELFDFIIDSGLVVMKLSEEKP